MTLEVAALAVGGAVVKSALAIWLGGNKIAVDVASASVDAATKRLSGIRDKRRLQRMADQTAEIVADRLEPFIRAEFRDIPESERMAAIQAVADTLDRVALRDEDMFAVDLDAGHLDRYVRRVVPNMKDVAGLSAGAGVLYDRLLREACTYTIQLNSAFPRAGMTGLAELLRRDTQMLEALQDAFNRLPERRGEAAFERDYRQLVSNRLDQIEFFGATISEESRRYPLSIAYLSLTVSAERTPSRPVGHVVGERIPEALSGTNRLVIRGEAGLGKTTLLQWIAVQSARGSFDPPLGDWNGTVPFYVALRRHAEGQLPAPEEFVLELGRHVAAEMPPGWVHASLRSGRAVVLIDGVDELPTERRGDVRTWLRSLVDTFPGAKYVITSRPAAVPFDWLREEHFEVRDMEPMSLPDIREFVRRWHAAMRAQSLSTEERERLEAYEQGLLCDLDTRGHLRRLAGYPLLAALLCALHRDRRAQLPDNRMELYEVSLHMLLERRDLERGLKRVAGLNRTTQTLLLQDIAYWLIRNGWSEVHRSRVLERIGTLLPTLAKVEADESATYSHLLIRSGLLREPAHEQMSFVHRTFQEYLAAKAAIEADDVGILLDSAKRSEWREVIVMAAGHAKPRQRAELISGLLALGDRDPDYDKTFHLLAVSCIETAPELAPDIRKKVATAAAGLLPPKTLTAARNLAAAGPFILDLLANSEVTNGREVAATIRTVAEIGDPAGINLIARFVNDRRDGVLRELWRAWDAFDPDDFAKRVLSHIHLSASGEVFVENSRIAAAFRYLPNVREVEVGTGISISETRAVLESLRGASSVVRIRHDRSGVIISEMLAQLGRSKLVLDATPGRKGPPHDYQPTSGDHPTSSDWIFTDGSSVGFAEMPQPPELQDEIPRLVGRTKKKRNTYPVRICVTISDIAELRRDIVDSLPVPVSFAAFECNELVDIGFLEKWRYELNRLAFTRCPKIDPSVLPSLSSCDSVRLSGCSSEVLDAVASLPRLATLRISDGQLPDLGFLRRAAALRALVVAWSKEVDLSPLRGVRDLHVLVHHEARVDGADLLGPGSTVSRTGRRPRRLGLPKAPDPGEVLF